MFLKTDKSQTHKKKNYKMLNDGKKEDDDAQVLSCM